MTKTSALAYAALAAALVATGCAASKDAPPPPTAATAPAAEIAPAPPAAPRPTGVAAADIASLGLRGASASSAPAGGASLASAGRADAEDAASDIVISYPPADEDGLDALLTTLAEAQPAAAEPEPAAAIPERAPAPAPQAGSQDEPFEMTALVASPYYPLTPAEPVRPARSAPAHAEIEAAAVQVATAAEPLPEPAAESAAESFVEPVVESGPMTLAAVDTRMTPVPQADASPEASFEPAPLEPSSSGLQRLEDFYTCDYAPAQRRGAVALVTCR